MENERNLLDETTTILKMHNKTWHDVLWVGRKNGTLIIPLDQVAKIFDFQYDASYGGNEVKTSLVVIGDSWWLERGEYDGAEWWEFKQLPVQAKNATIGHSVESHDEDDTYWPYDENE